MCEGCTFAFDIGTVLLSEDSAACHHPSAAIPLFFSAESYSYHIYDGAPTDTLARYDFVLKHYDEFSVYEWAYGPGGADPADTDGAGHYKVYSTLYDVLYVEYKYAGYDVELEWIPFSYGYGGGYSVTYLPWVEDRGTVLSSGSGEGPATHTWDSPDLFWSQDSSYDSSFTLEGEATLLPPP